MTDQTLIVSERIINTYQDKILLTNVTQNHLCLQPAECCVKPGLSNPF
ncbi:hypothetical protein UNH65_17000 [Chitinophaga sp. 180180018-2]|nr:hypothetical protein [Chitinophaga sp. 212800010-3]